MSNISNSFNEKLRKLKDNSPHSNYWNISWELGLFLTNFISIIKPMKVLELGTSNGFSTLCIAKGMSENSEIFTVEIDETRFNESVDNFKSFGVANMIKSFNSEIFEFLDKTAEKEFDFIFIDAAHKKYKDIFNIIISKGILSKDSTIIFDNVISHSYMSEFVEYIKSLEYDFQLLNLDSGFLIVYFRINN